jgi:transcription initiation factor IIE alpha subunit
MKAVRLPKVIDALQMKGMTAPELALKVFCTERSAQQMINKLREAGNVHIQTWRKSKNVWVAVYRYGIGSDAAKPKPLTAYERIVRHREKESLDDKAFRLARERGKRLKPRRDPLVAALFGER